MRKIALFFLLATLAAPACAQEAWKAVEETKFYAISGQSGPALYDSIGQHGPKASIGRTIAVTDFKLTWRRQYVEEDGACILRAARPRLVLTYRLPKPSEKLPPAIRANWQRFADGVRAHEKVHGDIIIDMVRAIEAETVGLRAENDPGCRKIKPLMNERLARLSLAQRERSRDFDRMEMQNGGAVHRLILALVNGG